MPFVRANPNQYLLVGRGGLLHDRGSAVQSYLLPGTVWVIVPADKQEATFEFTQETRDGIPLRFKGIVIYRISDPVVAAGRFNFVKPGLGIDQVNTLLTHVVLGELRHAVSHMTMAECIEERKTTLAAVISTALEATIHGPDGAGWGLSVEVAQLAQVFIVDPELRNQLEAEIRNEIKLRSDQSGIRTAEEARLAAMASAERVAAQQLAVDQEGLRRSEALFGAEMAAAASKANTETPVRMLQLAREAEVLREELAVRALRNELRAAEVEHDMLAPRAEQALRKEILPLEQAPRIVDSAARALNGTQLTLYGDGAPMFGHLAPLFDAVARGVRQAVRTDVDTPSETTSTPEIDPRAEPDPTGQGQSSRVPPAV